MRRNEHVGARVLAVTGLLGGTAYLGWRLAASMQGAPAWLALPFFVVEVFGFIGAVLLVWALWPMPLGRLPDDRRRYGDPVDAVVRIAAQPLHELRATLLSLRSVEGVGDVIVVDHDGRPEVASMALEFQAVYAATDPDDRSGLRVMIAAVRSAEFLLLDAGDVPATDIVRCLSVDLADLNVAVVQGLGVSLSDDSPEHGPDRRHELLFERSALNPALGRRGVAVWLGSGSLVRTAALRDVTLGASAAVEAHWAATSALHGAGWRITAPCDIPVVAHRSLRTAEEVYRDRVHRVRGARQMLFGEHGALRITSHTAAQRAAALAWAVRPLSSVRRVAFLALLCGALLAGEVPFHATLVTMTILWVPYFVYVSLSLALLSGWTLRPGDRARWSLHNIGATFNSGVDPDDVPERAPIVNLPASQYGASLVVATVVLSVVLVLRGMSDRLTHTMGTLPQPSLLAMVAVSLWLLVLSLDQLRVLGRRSHRRRATRIGAALSASLGERAVSLLDITSFGAGVMSHAGFEVGEAVILEAAVPTRTGVTTVCIPTVVRNVSVLPLGEYRLGVEFHALDDATANALAEYCVIEPVWEQMGLMPGTSITESRPLVPVGAWSGGDLSASAGRMAMRVISLLALAGAMASVLPARAEASAQTQRWTGAVVVDGAVSSGIVLTAVCGDGADERRLTALSDDIGRFSIDLADGPCRGYVSAPAGAVLTAAATMSHVDVSTAAGSAATTGGPGLLVAEVLSTSVANEEPVRSSLSLVLLALIAMIAGSLLVGFRRPKNVAIA